MRESELSWGEVLTFGNRYTPAGKQSLAFDCVFNISLKNRSTKDVDFRTFITGSPIAISYICKSLTQRNTTILELALERVEDKSGLTLSRGSSMAITITSILFIQLVSTIHYSLSRYRHPEHSLQRDSEASDGIDTLLPTSRFQCQYQTTH